MSRTVYLVKNNLRPRFAAAILAYRLLKLCKFLLVEEHLVVNV